MAVAEGGALIAGMVVIFFLLLYVLFFVFWIIFAVLMMAGFVLWIVMLIDVIQRKFENDNDRILWVLVVVLTGMIGAAIYYLVVKSKDKKVDSPPKIK
jgi:TctA family transporter